MSLEKKQNGELSLSNLVWEQLCFSSLNFYPSRMKARHLFFQFSFFFSSMIASVSSHEISFECCAAVQLRAPSVSTATWAARGFTLIGRNRVVKFGVVCKTRDINRVISSTGRLIFCLVEGKLSEPENTIIGDLQPFTNFLLKKT